MHVVVRRDRPAVGGIRRRSASPTADRGESRGPRIRAARIGSSITGSTGRRICICITSTSVTRFLRRDRYLAPIRRTVWAAHAGDDYRKQNVGYRRQASPRANFHEQVWEHEMGADAAGKTPSRSSTTDLPTAMVSASSSRRTETIPRTIRVAEPAGRTIRPRHRAFDKPRFGQIVCATPRRNDLARARRRKNIHDAICRARRRGRNRLP